MYSDKENINILTVLLVRHGVNHVVVCPGSRNAPLVHNFNECPHITCHAVTDERSAAFQALGIAQALQQPVAVCVTSGTALLNMAPAVAEARHQHVPLVVISADRPAAWIGQQVGQTISQPGALARFTLFNANVPEPTTDEQRWHCNRQINEALLAARHGAPVHINVPLGEPLFHFTVKELPAGQRVITHRQTAADKQGLLQELQPFLTARRPMVVIGQLPRPVALTSLPACCVVLNEALSGMTGGVPVDEVLPLIRDDDAWRPDHVLYMGGTLVSKHLKQWLASCDNTPMTQVSADGTIHDTFTHLTQVIQAPPAQVLELLDVQSCTASEPTYVSRWNTLLQLTRKHYQDWRPDFSQLMAVQMSERMMSQSTGTRFITHCANSQPVRLANIYAQHHVWCNRGTNGIEGTTSAAVGWARVTDDRVVCVTGDLSFFYDVNALWNNGLRGNLRILLLNNHGGGIFRQLAGLEASPARNALVAGGHHLDASNCCRQYGVDYRAAYSSQDLYSGLTWLLQDNEADAARLLEVVTDPDNDQQAWQQARESLKQKYQSWKKENGNP